MIKRVLNLFADKGCDYSKDLSLTDKNKQPLSLIDSTLQSKILNTYDVEELEFDIEILDDEAGTFTLSLAEDITTLMDKTYYYYNIDVINNDIITRIYSGIFKVSE